MKKTLIHSIVALGVLLCASVVCEAQSLSQLGKLMGAGTQKQDTTTTEQKTENQVMSQLGKLMGGATQSGETTTTEQNVEDQVMSQLGKLMGGATQSGETTATEQKSSTTTGSTASQLGNLLNNALSGGTSSGASGSSSNATSILGDIIGGVIAANTELTVESLAGTWSYVAPACKFVSEDFLKSAGGEVVASKINEELAPLYAKVGVTNGSFGFTFEESGDFVMNYGILPIAGVATKAEEKGIFTLEFVKLGTIAIATTPAHFEVVGDKMIMLFEADKLVNMLRSVVSKLGITSLNTIFELVDSYDGVLIGFELKKQAAQ